MNRIAAVGGIVGPVSFVGAWVAGGLIRGANGDGYSPVHDAISRLAAIGASTRPLMTSGFAVFGLGVTAFAGALRKQVVGPAWIAAAATGISTIAVALAPLEHSASIDNLHAVFAGLGYVTLASVPLLACRPLIRAGHRGLAGLGIGAGCVAAVSLALTTTGLPTGFFQRVGLTAGDLWIAATAVAIATGTLDGSSRSIEADDRDDPLA